ncbi:dinucleotide-utilizing enzyme [Microbacterium sp. W1N]|uniref:dinucleotide-utilizing enzyme n=1 Tax=Microbacterium festucae TaxID=2977531 RepID=UPI0021BFA439|nr:dinucleotide-utilizing enzyme [Microbacterium festucae]MCT9819972.1 dinucleotide-utilizing enzyme [Microbacterium festucae]
MSNRPRLSRSIPFWGLIVGSAASAGVGAALLLDKLGGMDARLTDGSATSNDVYVGQIWGVFGAILIGAGLVGLALALTVASLCAFVPRPAADVVDAPAFVDETADAGAAEPARDGASDADETDVPENTDTDTNGYGVDLGYSRPRDEESVTTR